MQSVLVSVGRGDALAATQADSSKALVNLVGDLGNMMKGKNQKATISKLMRSLAERSETYLPKIDEHLDCYTVSRLARGLTRLSMRPEPEFHQFIS